MNKTTRFSPEVRERAVRLVIECRAEHPSPWAAVVSIAAKIGCRPQTLLGWVHQHEKDTGQRDGTTTAERERIKALEREVHERRKTNERRRLAGGSLIPHIDRVWRGNLEVYGADKVWKPLQREGVPGPLHGRAAESQARVARHCAGQGRANDPRRPDDGVPAGLGDPAVPGYANALAETANDLYKAELVPRRAPWQSFESLELATREWVSWFNHQRPQDSLGYSPPAAAEANNYQQLAAQHAHTGLLN